MTGFLKANVLFVLSKLAKWFFNFGMKKPKPKKYHITF